MFMRFTGKYMHLHAEIPEPYAPCEAFFHLYEGRIAGLPQLIGLAPAIVLDRRIGPRVADHIFEVPEAPSVVTKIRRLPRKALGWRAFVLTCC